MATARQGASILPSGTYTSDTAQIVRQVNLIAAASEGVFSALKAGIAAIQTQVASFVEKANPAAVQRFKFAVDDLTGVIGRALTPVLVNMTAIIQKLADYLYALSPASKAMIAGLTAAAVGFTVVAVGVWALNAAFSTLTGGLSTILGAIGAFAVGVVFATDSTDKISRTFSAMLAPLAGVFDVISEIVVSLIQVGASFVEAFLPVIEVVASLAQVVANGLLVAVQAALVPIAKLAAIFRAVVEFALEVLGIQLGGLNGPPKAPAAVRPAQVGGLNEFLNRQLVNALEKPGGKVDAIQIGQGIAKDVAECKEWLKLIFGKPAEVRADAAIGIAQAINWLPNLAGNLMDRVVGK